MRQHIDTAPVWEAYRQDCECPLCALAAKAEASLVSYFLGESVMQPSQRVEVNEKGFCADHFKKLYDAGNRLGLALMTHTYMKNTLGALKENAARAREAAGSGRSVLTRLGGRKGGDMQEVAQALGRIERSCLLCKRMRESMERYVYTLLYMYGHEAEFPALLMQSKGMCLRHYAQTLEMAPKHLSGDRLRQFVETLTDIEIRSFERIAGELEGFTNQFDYRNQDKPWGNSRDAVRRAVNKLGHQVIDD